MSLKLGPSGGISKPYDTGSQDPKWKVHRVNLRAGDRIDGIQLVWTDGVTFRQSDWFGNPNGGSEYHYPIKDGDYLVKIVGSVGIPDPPKDSLRVYTLEFFTKDGSHERFPPKNETPYKFYYECCADHQINGIFGWADAEVDALGVYTDVIPPA